MNKSVATIDRPEFINLQPTDISPFIKQGEVKVLYTGENRNGSFISKDTAERMGKTLRGAPIVGFYKDDVGDMSAYLLKHVIGDPLHENDTGETGADEFLEYIWAPQLVVRLGG